MNAIVRGARLVVRAWPVWLLTWVLTLALAALLAVPAAALLARDLGHSLYATRMLGNFEPQYMVELLLQTARAPVRTFPPLVAAAAALYVLLATFLNGGAIAVYANRAGGLTAERFWSGCGRNFWRLLRLLLLALACYALVYAANFGLAKLGRSIWGEGMEERPVVLFAWWRAGVVVLLALFVNMVYDYAKIRLVFEDRRSATRAALASFRFVARHPWRCGSTYAALCVLVAALAAAAHVGAAALPRTALVGILLVILVQQAFIAGRLGARLLFFAAQVEVYRALHPTPPRPEPALQTE